MPHLHSALGENFTAGMTLTPESYRDLFVEAAPRLFSDKALLDHAIAGTGLDLANDVTPADLGAESSFTLIANRGGEIYRQYRAVGTPRGLGPADRESAVSRRAAWRTRPS